MSQSSSKSVRKEYVAKAVLMSIFLGGFAIFIGWMLLFGPGLNLFKLTALDMALLAFSTYRLGRLIAYDRVMEPLRQFFTNTIPDPTGEGETVDPKGQGFQQAIGQLICCPICAGTWVAALLTYFLYIAPGPAHVFLTMTAAIGAAELLGAMTEALSWTGQYARTMSGAKALERERQRREDAAQAAAAEAAERQVVERGSRLEPKEVRDRARMVEFPERSANHQAETLADSLRDYR